VFFAGIIGVPWQDIQTNTKPDGSTYPNAAELHYQTAAQLLANGTWGVVLGNDDPGGNAPPILPTDALMIESKDPRGGCASSRCSRTSATTRSSPRSAHGT